MKTKFFTLFLSFILILSLSSCRNYTFKSGVPNYNNSSSNSSNNEKEPETPNEATPEQPIEKEYITDYEIGDWTVQNIIYDNGNFYIEVTSTITNNSNYDMKLYCTNLILNINDKIDFNSGIIYTIPEILSTNETGYMYNLYCFSCRDLYPDLFKNVTNSEEFNELCDKLYNNIDIDSITSYNIDDSQCIFNITACDKTCIESSEYKIQINEMLYGYNRIQIDDNRFLNAEFPGSSINVTINSFDTDMYIGVDVISIIDSGIRKFHRCSSNTLGETMDPYYFEPSYKTKYQDIIDYKVYVYKYECIKQIQ